VASGAGAWACLPAAPGVVSLERRRASVQVSATGDLRRFVAQRLGDEAEGSVRGDLRGVVDRVRACRLGSAVEADFAYLEWGRELAPESYRAAADRWRGWFLRLDPESDVPVWQKTNLSDAAGVDAATLIGPMPTKDSAAKYGRSLDGVFELCREPKLLAQRPDAVACSYKEMGCPAPCDGSEPMSSYRLRVRQALEMASVGPEAGVDRRASAAAEAMTRASAALDFEQAATLKVLGEALSTLGGRNFRRVTTLDRFAAVVVLGSTRRGWCRVLGHTLGETRWWGDVPAAGVKAAVADLAGWLAAWRAGWRAMGEGDWLDRAAVERIGLVCHVLARPPRGAGRAISVSDACVEGWDGEPAGSSWGTVARVMRAVCRADPEESIETPAEGAGPGAGVEG